MKFVKMEGIGNDYIYTDSLTQTINRDKDYITHICDRHFGIGGDGLIVLEESTLYDFKMTMYNNDGSVGNMCGNGIRCLAKYAYDQGFTTNTHIEFETKSGLRIVDLLLDNNRVVGAKVDMGIPSLNVLDSAMNFSKDTCINEEVDFNGTLLKGTTVSMGNPHFVMIRDDQDFNNISTIINNSSLFNEGVNIEFIEIIDTTHIKMRVHERGTGETLACGTGACASMYACFIQGLVENKVDVLLKGGHLQIEYKNEHIMMTGPATEVFKGEIEDE